MTNIEQIAKDICIEYITGMSMALAVEHTERFDFFYEMYGCTVGRYRELNRHTAAQMDKLVGKLYERRLELNKQGE